MTRKDVAQILGVLVLLYCTAALIFPDVRKWGERDVGIAIPTAICFVLLSIAVGLKWDK